MSDRYPFSKLKAAIDGPVIPRTLFATELRKRLVEDLATPGAAREETAELAAPFEPKPVRAQSLPRFVLPTLLRIAAVIVLIVVAFVVRPFGWNDPPPPGRDGSPPRGAIVAPFTAATPPAIGSPDPAWQDEPLWRSIPAGEAQRRGVAERFAARSLATSGEQVFRLLVTDQFEGVMAVDAATGAELWQWSLDLGADPWVVTGSGMVHVLSDRPAGSILISIDAESGEVHWSRETTVNTAMLLVWNDSVIVWDGRSRLEVIASDSGEQVGTRELSVGSNSNDAVAPPSTFRLDSALIASEMLILGSSYGWLAALPIELATTAEVVWSQELGGPVSSLVVSDNAVAAWYQMIGSGDRLGQPPAVIAAFDVTSGEHLWETDENPTTEPPFTITEGFAFITQPTPVVTLPPGAVVLHMLELAPARTGPGVSGVEGLDPVISLPDGGGLIGAANGAEGMREIVFVDIDRGLPTSSIEVLYFDQTVVIAVDDLRLYYIDGDGSLVAYSLADLDAP